MCEPFRICLAQAGNVVGHLTPGVLVVWICLNLFEDILDSTLNDFILGDDQLLINHTLEEIRTLNEIFKFGEVDGLLLLLALEGVYDCLQLGV